MQGNRHRNQSDQNRAYSSMGNGNYQDYMTPPHGRQGGYQVGHPSHAPPQQYHPYNNDNVQHYQPPPMNNPYNKYQQPPPYQQPPQYPPYQPQYPPQYDDYQPPQPPKKPSKPMDSSEYESPSLKSKKTSGGVRDFSENGIFTLKN